MNRRCSAIILVQKGRGGLTQHRVQRVVNFQTEESVDNDADTFSIELGDSKRELDDALDRDNEVRVNIFLNNARNVMVPIFTGIADTVQRDENFMMTITGRDTPSSLAMDCDAIPQRWKNVRPDAFIAQQAQKLGIVNTQIAKKMSPIKTIFTDGSETEWAFWYRIARMREMYMWTDHRSGGTLYVDKLGYGLKPSYKFGDPPRGYARNDWQPVEGLAQITTKQGRKRRVIIYGTAPKKKKQPGRALVQQAVDTTIASWRKQAVSVMTTTVDKTVQDLHKRAGAEVFEAIVGAVEYQLTVRDTGQLIDQNTMCQVNLPKYGIVGSYYIVGVTRSGGEIGMTQTVRIREKGFALSKRVPDPPILAKTKTSVTDDYKPATSIAGYLASSGVRWPDSFVRATREHGQAWDFAVFLGALLSICEIESGFANVRQTSTKANVINHVEWKPYQQFINDPIGVQATTPEGAHVGPEKPASRADIYRQYEATFANESQNSYNPFAPAEAGVGPMQLTTLSFKQEADQLGWNGQPKVGELDGGRWNPDSNIRIAAKVLADKAKLNPPADPTNADNIWIAVERYNGSGEAAIAYARHARSLYSSRFESVTTAAVSNAKSLPPNTTDTSVNLPGHGVIELPAATPPEARKAIAFALRHLGDPYVSGGGGEIVNGTPAYDCSSLVTAALASGAAYLRNELDYARPGHHGDTTYTLYRQGRFKAVAKDDLLPADLVFFTGAEGTETAPGHVGMYLGDNLFIQDSGTRRPVNIDSLGNKYYIDTYVGARRLVNWTVHPST